MDTTNNQKDLLFKISDFFRHKVLDKDIDNPRNHIEIQKWAGTLVDEGVIKEEDSIDLERALITLLSVVRLSN